LETKIGRCFFEGGVENEIGNDETVMVERFAGCGGAFDWESEKRRGVLD
jgi:hypothetical protein